MSSELIAQFEELDLKDIHDTLNDIQDRLNRGYRTEGINEWPEEKWKAYMKNLECMSSIFQEMNRKTDELELTSNVIKKQMEEHEPLTDEMKREFNELDRELEVLRGKVNELESGIKAFIEESRQKRGEMAN